MRDGTAESLTILGDFNPAQPDRGRVEGIYPSTLLLGTYRRSGDNAPCQLFLRCWPDGRVQFLEIVTNVAKNVLKARKRPT